METFSRCFSVSFLSSLTFVLLVRAQDQTGFISLDCGLPANSLSYTEPTTTINYISDAAFINTGESRTILSKYKALHQRQVWYLRSFSRGIRNCYSIRIIIGTRYLIRASFLYGNYDGMSKLPTFKIYLGDSLWDTVKFTSEDIDIAKELIHLPSINEVHICLINTGHGIPFISALEFRPLPNNTYDTKSGSLSSVYRIDIGSTIQGYRFPYDVLDRYWNSDNAAQEYTQINTSLTVTIDAKFMNDYNPPSIVMGTAVTGKDTSKPTKIFWDSEDENTQYYAYLHFVEVVKLQHNQTRGFNISYNGKLWYGPLILSEYVTTIYNTGPLSVPGTRHEFSLFKIENSTLPPIINALEIYAAIEIFELRSNQEDKEAIRKIMSTYGVTKDWQGDPCIPRSYPWSGLGCSNETFPRIMSLNLSSHGLTGEISPDISNLATLQTLDLSNNNLKGEVPDSLSKLSYLRVLKLDNNKLTGQIPPALIKKSKEGSLSLSVEGNPNIDACALGSCTKEKKKKKNLLILAPVSGLLAIVIIAGVIFRIASLKNKRRSKGVATAVDHSEASSHFTSREIRRRQFTYSEVVKMTNHFERILGKGGFGKVYHGVIGDIQVAVKMLSPSAIQGDHQFQAEVSILLRVHHKNLTSLVGYLNEGTHLGLIYEYMANGNLAQHLYGKDSCNLSWEDRIRIAIDAAKGLEYLHDGCNPTIVHRDVKTTNILLTENFRGKLSDFGLSKSYPTDESHMSTVVVGTAGYVDPEYYMSCRLTEKSDVFSFGITLLEIVSCRPVLSRNEDQNMVYIVKWVGSKVAQGDIKNIVDPRLKGQCDLNSVWKAVEVAMACVSTNPKRRPAMNQVIAELKDCLATELNRMPESCPLNSTDSIEMKSIPMDFPTQSGPVAR